MALDVRLEDWVLTKTADLTQCGLQTRLLNGFKFKLCGLETADLKTAGLKQRLQIKTDGPMKLCVARVLHALLRS